MCKLDCIDEDKIFCPGTDYKSGICCAPNESPCPAGSTTFDSRYNMPRNWCSNFNDDSGYSVPITLKYFVCPNENACGDGGNKFITPN